MEQLIKYLLEMDYKIEISLDNGFIRIDLINNASGIFCEPESLKEGLKSAKSKANARQRTAAAAKEALRELTERVRGSKVSTSPF